MVLKIEGNQSSRSVKIQNQGHYKLKGIESYAEVWGCTTHPTEDGLFASAGGDKRVRIWSFDKEDMGEKIQLRQSEELEHDATSLSWSYDAKWICVGDREA